MAQTWVTNNGTKPNFIGGKLLQPGEGTFVETPAPSTPEPAQVQAQLTGAGDLELVVDGARYRAMSPAKAAAFDSLVSPDGNLPSALVASTTGTPGEIRKISDGPNKGVNVVWSIPSGGSAYAWCWQIFPMARYP